MLSTFIVSCNFSDIDECSENTHKCHVNATCTNTAGHYTCECNNGYTGGGMICTGNVQFINETTLSTSSYSMVLNVPNSASIDINLFSISIILYPN